LTNTDGLNCVVAVFEEIANFGWWWPGRCKGKGGANSRAQPVEVGPQADTNEITGCDECLVKIIPLWGQRGASDNPPTVNGAPRQAEAGGPASMNEPACWPDAKPVGG
jgi:hypothetical protein